MGPTQVVSYPDVVGPKDIGHRALAVTAAGTGFSGDKPVAEKPPSNVDKPLRQSAAPLAWTAVQRPRGTQTATSLDSQRRKHLNKKF